MALGGYPWISMTKHTRLETGNVFKLLATKLLPSCGVF